MRDAYLAIRAATPPLRGKGDSSADSVCNFLASTRVATVSSSSAPPARACNRRTARRRSCALPKPAVRTPRPGTRGAGAAPDATERRWRTGGCRCAGKGIASTNAHRTAIVHRRALSLWSAGRPDDPVRSGAAPRPRSPVQRRQEHADLELPLLQVGSQQRRLLVVGELDRVERLRPPADTEPPLTARAQVLDPLRVTARRDQIVGALVVQKVDRGLSPFAGLAALDLEDARAVYAHAQARQRGNDAD